MHTESDKGHGARRVFVIGALCLILGFSGGYALSARMPAHASSSASVSGAPADVDFAPVWKAWSVIDEKFVPAAVSTSTPTTTPEEARQKRVWGMIEGMAASLGDPYTFFMPPAESKEFQDEINGSFQGVGMEVAVKDEVLTVVSPLRGTPAERAGIKSGDHVLKIDGKDTRGMDAPQAVKLIRGPKGTRVELLIERSETKAPFTITITRDVINIPIVETKRLDGGVFVIQVMSFTATSPDLFRNALREFVSSGDTKLIIDLRGNPGGYLEAAVDIGSWFLPLGDVIVTEDYDGHGPSVVHRSRGYDAFNSNLRMAILVDKGSASASEILAGALRNHGKATLIGTETFGKGSVQELVDITPQTALKITVAHWLTPNGTQIPTTGIVPDITVKMSDDDLKAKRDPQRDRAVEFLTKGE